MASEATPTDTTPAAAATATATTRKVSSLVEATEAFVRAELASNDSSHDFFHIHRVRNTALRLAKEEGIEDLELVEVSALLHDVGDWKYSGSDTSGPDSAKAFLTEQGYASAKIDTVIAIMHGVSFSSELDNKGKDATIMPELAVVQDADRLDAIGAIGIARCLTYGGAKHRVLHDPAKKPLLLKDKAMYRKNNKATSINHFYEKLLLLKDMMKTKAGRATAEKRHKFMEAYLEQFHAEWRGEA